MHDLLSGVTFFFLNLKLTPEPVTLIKLTSFNLNDLSHPINTVKGGKRLIL